MNAQNAPILLYSQLGSAIPSEVLHFSAWIAVSEFANLLPFG